MQEREWPLSQADIQGAGRRPRHFRLRHRGSSGHVGLGPAAAGAAVRPPRRRADRCGRRSADRGRHRDGGLGQRTSRPRGRSGHPGRNRCRLCQFRAGAGGGGAALSGRSAHARLRHLHRRRLVRHGRDGADRSDAAGAARPARRPHGHGRAGAEPGAPPSRVLVVVRRVFRLRVPYHLHRDASAGPALPEGRNT